MVPHDDGPTPPPAAPPPARAGASPQPIPVRASLGDDHGEVSREEQARDTVELVVNGTSWTVRVGGRSRSGSTLAPAPILLLQFESSQAGGGASREAWVVAQSLAVLTDLQIEAAFRRSSRAPEGWKRKSLFPEAGSRSGKDS